MDFIKLPEAERVELRIGNCLDVLKTLPDAQFHTCVTSPPYYGLRDYGTARWEGGDPACDHGVRRWEGEKQTQGAQSGHAAKSDRLDRKECACGAVRVDEQIGLEDTPEAFVQRLVEVFREVRRCLRDDGTLWVNIGDSYAANRTYQVPSTKGGAKHGPGQSAGGKGATVPTGLKAKDLIGIPWRLAFALQADGWYLRQDIIWSKPNVMPESVKDRCTKAHEYIFMFAKNQRYYFDADAIKEPSVMRPQNRHTKRSEHPKGDEGRGQHRRPEGGTAYDGRNRRSVWTVNTKPFSGAHFAVYPPELIEPCILAGSPKDGHVLDPFGGSGTTGLVAADLGRNATLIELNPDYGNIIRSRLEHRLHGFDQAS